MDFERDGLTLLLNRAIEYSALKEVDRSGWVLRGVERPESVADHSWGTAQLCLLFAPYAALDAGLRALDPHRAVSMALVHDLAEVHVGDIPRRRNPDASHPSVDEKARLEDAAIVRLTTAHGEAAAGPAGMSLHLVGELWREYEGAASPAARFVRDMNLIDMCLQAYVYERDKRYDPAAEEQVFPDYPRMGEFFETSRSRLSTALGRRLHAMIEERYRAVVAGVTAE